MAGTLIKNNDNKLVICRRQLIKGKYNLSAYKPILVSDSDTKKNAVNNSKSPQPITKPKGIY
jgi:hypothetical protein